MKTYPVNEVFESIQGEGFHAGRPAIFVRFSGCNLSCDFCDTDHTFSEDKSPVELRDMVRHRDSSVWAFPKLVVFTGGEPLLHLDWEIVELLAQDGYHIAVETNGTLPPLETNVHRVPIWYTVSPKFHSGCKANFGACVTFPLDRFDFPNRDIWLSEEHGILINEVKVVFTGTPKNMEEVFSWQAFVGYCMEKGYKVPGYLQPCWVPDEHKRKRYMNKALSHAQAYPCWKISVQLHKYLGVR